MSALVPIILPTEDNKILWVEPVWARGVWAVIQRRDLTPGPARIEAHLWSILHVRLARVMPGPPIPAREAIAIALSMFATFPALYENLSVGSPPTTTPPVSSIKTALAAGKEFYTTHPEYRLRCGVSGI